MKNSRFSSGEVLTRSRGSGNITLVVDTNAVSTARTTRRTPGFGPVAIKT